VFVVARISVEEEEEQRRRWRRRFYKTMLFAYKDDATY